MNCLLANPGFSWLVFVKSGHYLEYCFSSILGDAQPGGDTGDRQPD